MSSSLKRTVAEVPSLEADLCDRVVTAAMEFVISRDVWSRAKAARNAYCCLDESSGDLESGDAGVPACFRVEETPIEEMCEECQKRAAAHAEVVRVRDRALLALPKLQRAVRAFLKLHQGDTKCAP